MGELMSRIWIEIATCWHNFHTISSVISNHAVAVEGDDRINLNKMWQLKTLLIGRHLDDKSEISIKTEVFRFQKNERSWNWSTMKSTNFYWIK